MKGRLAEVSLLRRDVVRIAISEGVVRDRVYSKEEKQSPLKFIGSFNHIMARWS